MPPVKYQAKVIQHLLYKGTFQWIRLRLENQPPFTFKAGQFLMLDIPGFAGKRSYSIASVPALVPEVDLLIDVKPQGHGCRYLQSLRAGDSVSFMAPAGQFFIKDQPEEKKLVMIATGSGISAIRSMTLDLLLSKRDTRPISLHWGMRHIDDLFWIRDFRFFQRRLPNFTFDLVLSKGPESWPLCTGHVNECLDKHYSDYTQTGFYICGNQKVVDSISQLLTSKGVNTNNIHHEQFY